MLKISLRLLLLGGVKSVIEVDLPFLYFDCWFKFGMIGFRYVHLGLNQRS